MLTSIQLLPDVLEAHIRKLERKYKEAEKKEIRFEYYDPEGGALGEADVLLVGYGIVSRVLRSTAEQANRKGIRAALFRPISLYPFPSEALARASANARMVQVVEMSTGQMLEDVRLALEGEVPVEFFSRVGGNVPRAEEVLGELWKHSNLLQAEPRRAICRVRA
jgi:pyruvate/2-oxoacid:ferredoxin oxidoreductase alpha subunit